MPSATAKRVQYVLLKIICQDHPYLYFRYFFFFTTTRISCSTIGKFSVLNCNLSALKLPTILVLLLNLRPAV